VVLSDMPLDAVMLSDYLRWKLKWLVMLM